MRNILFRKLTAAVCVLTLLLSLVPYLAIGKDGKILLFSGQSLDVDSKNALICEHNPVPNRLKALDNLLSSNKHRTDKGLKRIVLHGPQSNFLLSKPPRPCAGPQKQLTPPPGSGPRHGTICGTNMQEKNSKNIMECLLKNFPYGKIQAFSVETSGVLDLDSELDLWFSGLGNFCN